MAFIASAATVTVTAKLTDAGKQKLYDSIESTSGRFITKFGLGDSDVDYSAIEGGVDVLASGHVPEPSAFVPKMRSHALFSGKYEPTIPVVLIGGNYGPQFNFKLEVGTDAERYVEFAVETEWPKNKTYGEVYLVSVIKPTSMSQTSFDRLFKLTSIGTNKWRFTEYVNTEKDLEYVFGNYTDNNTAVAVVSTVINIVGTESNQSTEVTIDLSKYTP